MQGMIWRFGNSLQQWHLTARRPGCRHPRSSLLQPAATPLGSLILAEAPPIEAENLFRQPGPPLSETPSRSSIALVI
jgi:hypothetical protein